MRKKWCVILVLLLLLTGCSKDTAPVDRPHSLEVAYGESAVYAQTSAYQWYWEDGRETASATMDAAEMGVSPEKIPYLNAGKDTALQLNFSKQPDKVLVQMYSADDHYATAQEVTLVGNSMPAPVDGGDYLFTVSAVWQENSDAENWGSVTYRFFFLSTGVIVSNPIELEVAADLDLLGLLELDASQVLGVEFVNNMEGTTRTCRSSADKAAILDFFRNNLVSDLQPSAMSVPQSEYALRLVTVSGSQLTVSYGGSTSVPCLTVGGVPYEVGALDMGALWNALGAGAISAEAAASGKNYLDMSDAFPGDDWGSDFVYGYLRQMDGAITYDEMRWVDDAAEPNGYRLENGWTGQSAALSADCQYWILEDHYKPYCRVTPEELWQWTEDADFDVLYRIYTSGDQVIAICQQYQP